MTRTILRLVLGTTLLCLIYVAVCDGCALARTQISSPFGNDSVYVSVGGCSTAPCQIIIWKDLNNGACATTTIGNGVGLVDDIEVSGGSGFDDMNIVGFIEQVCCGVTLLPLSYNGHYLDLYGLGGTDILVSETAGDSWLFGGDGNDLLDTNGPGTLFGGNGNDTLQTLGPFSSEGLYGEAGSDCLSDSNASAATVDCGSGTDTLTFSAPASVNCELFKTHC